MRTLIRNAKALIKDAKAQGADVSVSSELIGKAENALKSASFQEIPGLVREARTETMAAKRFFRSQRMIGNVIPFVDQANEMGADISEAMEFLHAAQTSLEDRNFGEVSENVKNIRNAIRRAKKRKRVEDVIDKMRDQITKSEKLELDVTRARELLNEAREAVLDERFADVQKLSRRLKKAISDAKLKKKMEDKLQSVRMDLEELRSMGVDTSAGEDLLEEASKAMSEGKYSKMQNLVTRNRRWIVRERKKRETELLVGAVGTLIEKASKGGKELVGAKELLKNFKRAIMSDKVGDLQELLEKDMQAWELEERKNRIQRRILRLRNLVRDISEYGEDTSELEEMMVKIERSFESGDIERAEGLMEEVERFESIVRLAKKRAKNLLLKAKSSMMHARTHGFDIEDVEETLLAAENLLGEESFLESIERAKAAHRMVERRVPEEAIARRKEIEDRLGKVRLLLDDARKANIDVSEAEKLLSEAETATEQGKLKEAEKAVITIEELGQEIMASLREGSEEFIHTLESSLDRMKEIGVSAPQVEEMLHTAKTYFDEGKYQASIEYARMAQKVLEETEKLIERKAKENIGSIIKGIELARSTGAHVDEAEDLIEEASAAIDTKEYSKFNNLAEMARGSLIEAEKLFLSDRARREMEEVQIMIGEAKTSGLGEIAEAEIVFKKAEDAYETEDYGIVTMLTDTAKEMLGESRSKKLIQQFVEKSKMITRLIEKSDEAGMGAEELQDMLRTAQESFAEHDYESALRLIEQSEDLARGRVEQFLRGKYPKIMVNLPVGAVQSDVWNKYTLEVTNEGNTTAEDVNVSLKGDFEVKGLRKISSLLPQEKKKMEVGLKPRQDGELPVDVKVSFKRPFDETNFESKDDATLNISRLGTYLVDDVFLVHNDGRLILHETREFREDVDDDIFSGMLTVMQEFVRDSFQTRSSTSLSRLDFGDNKIVIERGFYIYLATVLTGDEPSLLPLYMAEIVKEIEEKYADVLDNWSGLLGEMEGVEEIVKKIIFVSDDEEADIGELEESVITSTLQMLREAQAAGADVSQAQDLLHKAKKLLEEEDYASAWKFVEDAADSASKSKARIRGQLENALVQAQNSIKEAIKEGLEIDEAELMLDDADKAAEEFDAREVNSIVRKIDRVVGDAKSKKLELEIATQLDKAKELMTRLQNQGFDTGEAGELMMKARDARLVDDFESAEKYLELFRESMKKTEESLTSEVLKTKLSEFDQMTKRAKDLGIDVAEVEQKISQAEEALDKGDDKAAQDSLEEIGKLLVEARNLLSATEVDGYLDSVRDMVERARSIGIEVTDAEKILGDAQQLAPEDVENLRTIIERAESSATKKIGDYLKGKVPDIKLQLPRKGLQTDAWNKYTFEVANEGNIAARNLNIDLSGEFEVKGLEEIPHIDAKEKKEVEVGLKPAREGDIPIDVKISYQRYFDEKEYRLDDLKNVSVESQGTYLVEDVFLIHRDGRLIIHETRKYREEIDEDVFSGMLSVVQDFVQDSFRSKEKVGLKRLDFGESKILLERGKYVSVAAVVVGQEPMLLPLHVLEVIARIEDQFGQILESWSGLMSELSGIDEFVKELIFVTDKKEAITESLQSSLVTATFGAEGAHQIIEEARKVVETEDMDTAWEFISDMGDGVPPRDLGVGVVSPDVQLSPEFIEDLGDLADSPEFRGHIATLSDIVQCVSQARKDIDLDKKMPLLLVAIKSVDDSSATMISDFKRVLQDHLRTKELVVLGPGEDWDGLDLEITVNSDKIKEKYPQWSRKIEMLLNSQSPWKIKSGLDKGSYAVGIEGQQVILDSTMVSYEISVPERVAEYEFDKGKVWVDKRQTEELWAEGVAGEIIKEIANTKREAGLEEETPVEIRLCISDELKALLEDWMDDIITEVRCTSFKYRPVDWEGDEDAFSLALQLGDEEIVIYLKELAEAES
ncbi:MAG: hypothetical protein JSV43_08450 [Methanobacteriota archaeon]|nr:MAG: hypothetical protein JSV43_08450 [Euryarchaeota archaeon]